MVRKPKKSDFSVHEKYMPGTLAPKLIEFVESGRNSVVIEYGGERMNAIFGFEEDAMHTKPTLHLVLRLLKMQLIDKIVFYVMRGINGGKVKNWFYRQIGMKVGKDVFVASGVYIDEAFPELTTIDDGCIIGEGAMILNHSVTVKHVKFGRVHLKKQSVIGAQSIVQCGVTVGEGAVVAMNSVVNVDVADFTVVGGVPIHEIKKLKELI